MDAARLLEGRVAVLTGAGVSTESGIPDFRGPSGVWTRFDPDEFRFERLLADPRRFWTMRAKLMAEFGLERARPNAAHFALAAAAASPRLLGVATQNIDGLDRAAGMPEAKLAELHGNAANVRCLDCGFVEAYADVADAAASGAVTCARCAGIVKPDVVLFGEALDAGVLARAEGWARACDAFLAVGSSLSVWPAAGLAVAAAERGAALVIVNESPTELDTRADAIVRKKAGAALPALLAEAGLIA